MADITLANLTNGSVDSKGDWSGTGIFDVLMNAVNENIRVQYDKGRIKGSDFAQVYLQGIQAVLAQSVQYNLQEQLQEAQIDKLADDLLTAVKQRAALDAQTAKATDSVLTGIKQREVMDAQKLLYTRQKDSFDDNKYQKLFEAQLNYNGIVFQDAATPDVLNIALEARVNDVFNKITGNDPTLATVPEV